MNTHDIKRYAVSGDIAYPIHEDPEGDYVTYEDHVAAIEAYRKRITELESQLEGVLSERDAHHDMADQLSEQIAAITGQEIGEHSSGNDPWQNAMLAADEWIAEDLRKLTDGSDRQRRGDDQQPFGYFRPDPFGWTDCAATDDGSIALYERPPAQGEPKDRRDIRGIVKKLQSAYVKDGSTDEWIRLRRHVLEEAIDNLRLISADCAHFYDAYKAACDRAAPQPAEPCVAPTPHNVDSGAQNGFQATQPAELVKLECPKCGADRAKEPCAGNLMNCTFKGVAHAAEPVKQETMTARELADRVARGEKWKIAEPVSRDVEALVRLLEDGEWAEHVARTPLGQRLELAITALVGEASKPHNEPVKVDAKASVPSDAEIREVFLANGFVIKDGHDDLKPYVYDAARALLARYGTTTQEQP